MNKFVKQKRVGSRKEMLEELYLSIKDIGEVKVSELLNKNNKFMDYRNDYKVSKSEIIERTRNLAKLCK